MASAANRLKSVFTPKRVRVLQKMAAGTVVSCIPVGIWWKYALDARHKRAEDVRTKVRVPNVQSIDDLMIERCRPGDVLLFDRRWESCASGPMAALVCMLGRKFLCSEDPNKVIPTGRFDHCGMFKDAYNSRFFSICSHDAFLLYGMIHSYRNCGTRLCQEQGRRIRSIEFTIVGSDCWRRNCCTSLVGAFGNVTISIGGFDAIGHAWWTTKRPILWAQREYHCHGTCRQQKVGRIPKQLGGSFQNEKLQTSPFYAWLCWSIGVCFWIPYKECRTNVSICMVGYNGVTRC